MYIGFYKIIILHVKRFKNSGEYKYLTTRENRRKVKTKKISYIYT